MQPNRFRAGRGLPAGIFYGTAFVTKAEEAALLDVTRTLSCGSPYDPGADAMLPAPALAQVPDRLRERMTRRAWRDSIAATDEAYCSVTLRAARRAYA